MRGFEICDEKNTNCGNCPTGMVKGGTCAGHVYYKTPAVGISAFYTTWSFILCIAACGFALVYLAGSVARKVSKGYTPFAEVTLDYILLPLIILAAANSVGVLLCSQLILKTNIKNSFHVPKGTDINQDAVTIKFLNNMLGLNFDEHILPALLAVGLVVLIICVPKAPASKKYITFAVSLLTWLVFLIAYFCVPVQAKYKKPESTKSAKRDGKNLFFVDKINFVYNNPPWYVFVLHVITAITIICLLSSFL